eukprot:TRINITY_DN2998_c0_g1_i1.p1 TRINITY_DN2998_c0_g1~~TRINITY_DN2998_c0_g1_i1.p1  ORF type:complete len:264 (-),score=55.48 TRINITY_DN2998_c0_g1_i1:474-1265(-)
MKPDVFDYVGGVFEVLVQRCRFFSTDDSPVVLHIESIALISALELGLDDPLTDVWDILPPSLRKDLQGLSRRPAIHSPKIVIPTNIEESKVNPDAGSESTITIPLEDLDSFDDIDFVISDDQYFMFGRNPGWDGFHLKMDLVASQSADLLLMSYPQISPPVAQETTMDPSPEVLLPTPNLPASLTSDVIIDAHPPETLQKNLRCMGNSLDQIIALCNGEEMIPKDKRQRLPSALQSSFLRVCLELRDMPNDIASGILSHFSLS